MPEISRFLGIVILMYANEHNPPHLHVRYNDFAAVIDLRTLEVRDGKLPARVLGLVVEWVELHQSELLEIWDSKVFKKIDPLV
jgi:hypothetical protein